MYSVVSDSVTPWTVAHKALLSMGIPRQEYSSGLLFPIPDLLMTWIYFWVSLVVQLVKNLPIMQETWVWSLGGEDPLEKRMATLSSILAWRIPGMEHPGGLLPMGLQRVKHNWAAKAFFSPSGYISKVLSVTTLLTETTNGIIQTSEENTFQPRILEKRTCDHCLWARGHLCL